MVVTCPGRKPCWSADGSRCSLTVVSRWVLNKRASITFAAGQRSKMHSNCRLLPDDIVCKITQRNNIRRTNTCDPALKLLNEDFRHTKTQTEHMEGALRRSLGSQAHHTYSLEDHTWSIQQSTTTHTKHIHNIQQPNSNYTLRIVSPNNSQTLSNTQHTKQTDTLTEQHTTYKDKTSHSLLFRSKRL